MKCIKSHTDDPFFNLATEEYLLKHFREEFYFQYTNRPSVVIGKHQNALREIDLDYLQKEGIVLARRISGGGAVYHDHGNLNYSFVTNESPGNLIRFKEYTKPVINALLELGIPAHLGKRNELLSGEFKISGTASHVFKERVLHHGTLLFETDLEVLGKCLYVDSDRYLDKAVRSVRSRVTNLRDLMKDPCSMSNFEDQIYDYVLGMDSGNEPYILTDADLRSIGSLVDDRFETWDWNFGYSPKYEVQREIIFGDDKAILHSRIEKGRIVEIACESGQLPGRLQRAIEFLPGTVHDPDTIRQFLGVKGVDARTVREIAKALF